VVKKNALCLGLVAALGMVWIIVSCKNSGTPEPSVTNYTVSFQTGGGTEIAGKTVQEGTTLDLELSEYQPGRTGYFFNGWYLSGDAEQIPLTSIAVRGNITLVAKWLSSVSVILDKQGGELAGNPGSNIRPGSTFEAAGFAPTRKGYVFLHWYLKDDPSHAEVERIRVDTDITLVAEWEEGWVIELELDGGEYYREFITVARNDVTIELATIKPVKDDYVLEGWYYDADFASRVPDVITVDGDITLYVQWAPLNNYAYLFGVWSGSAGTYLLYFEQDGNSPIGFYFSDDEIRSFVWTDSTIDGKAFDFNSGTLIVGEGESANTFTPAITKMRPAGNVPLSKLWIKGGGNDPVSLYLFDSGNGFVYADGRFTDISYASNVGNIYLLRQNTDENGNPLAGEVLLAIPIVEGKPSGFEVMKDGGEGEGGIVPF
jgi:uncharacterized repeat protein (TIGR02543 family)